MEKKEHTSVMPTDLTLKLLEDITNNFSNDHKIGHGGYGEVYKGVLHTGEEIAVKKLHPTQGLDDEKFDKEFNNLMMIQHKNIVRLVGYCYEIRHKPIEIGGKYHFAQMAERALCFEFLQNGSLDKHLSDESCGLDWRTRYEIIKGICEGLNYLHNGCKDKGHIYHLDLKPANILLDAKMMAKIADFGLSRLFGTTQTHITKNFNGTLGYVPPEYIERRQISNKYDIFSLGIIIIQIIAGRLGYQKSSEMAPEQFSELVHENWRKRLYATSISHEADSIEVKMCIELALRCVERDRMRRPTIVEIINKLNEIETLKLSLVAQRSDSKVHVDVVMDPMELRFPFELNKEISCVLQLTNRSDGYVAFSAKANLSKYYSRPDRGVVPPWSKHYVVVTMRAQEREPPAMRCHDIFVVETTGVSESEVADAETMVAGKAAVDEVRLPIVYVALPQPAGASIHDQN